MLKIKELKKTLKEMVVFFVLQTRGSNAYYQKYNLLKCSVFNYPLGGIQFSVSAT